MNIYPEPLPLPRAWIRILIISAVKDDRQQWSKFVFNFQLTEDSLCKPLDLLNSAVKGAALLYGGGKYFL